MTANLIFRESAAIESAAMYRDFIAEEYEHAHMSPRIPLALGSAVNRQH